MSGKDTCRSCGAPIWWAITEKGRRMPLDPPGTHPDPNLYAWRDHVGILHVGAENPATIASLTETTSHFATCPNADQHRRPRSK
jgi:hypothetical protein